jgi:hypothetical protein
MTTKAKESTARGGKAANKSKAKNGKTQSRKEAKGGISLPSWASFTYKSVAFVHAAEGLSTKLLTIYGREVTISSFERMVAEFASLKAEEKALILLDKDCLILLQKYREAKDAKDTERKSFRSDTPLKDITTGLEACLSALDGPPETKEDK